MQINTKKIRQLMEDQKLQNATLAIMSGISPTRFGVHMAKGEAPQEVLEVIADALGVTVEEVAD